MLPLRPREDRLIFVAWLFLRTADWRAFSFVIIYLYLWSCEDHRLRV